MSEPRRNRAIVEFEWWAGEHDLTVCHIVEALMDLYHERTAHLVGADADVGATLDAPGLHWSGFEL